TRWHLLVSRLATNYGLLPVCVLLVVGSYVRAARRGGTGRWALVGAAAGFSLYSYTPARAIPVALAGAVGWEMFRGGARRISARNLGAALGALAIVAAPL